jgi:hypothetical protein
MKEARVHKKLPNIEWDIQMDFLVQELKLKQLSIL